MCSQVRKPQLQITSYCVLDTIRAEIVSWLWLNFLSCRTLTRLLMLRFVGLCQRSWEIETFSDERDGLWLGCASAFMKKLFQGS